jgi:D-glycero-alpha-D-manno-heptose-7-phosphate kinase
VRYKGRAPLRIDFGGGWTDVPVYAETEGGAVLNAAITHYVRGSIGATRPLDMVRRLRGERSYVCYGLDLPVGAGLGASAAQTVLWVALVKTAVANVTERHEIAEMACQIASALGILGGKQDEYASALGGIRYFTFGSGVADESLRLSTHFASQLRDRLVLVYSGQSRVSANIHDHVWSRFQSGEPSTVRALAGLRELPGQMKRALLASDLEGFAQLLNDNWSHQKSLHPSVTTRRLDDIFEFARHNGAQGGKACGAGGGGCLLFLATEGRAEQLRAALTDRRLKVIDFDFDHYGVFITRD